MKLFRKMDEMELHLSLNAIRVAWFFMVMALFVGPGGTFRRAASPRPYTCSSFRICCTSWLRRWAGGAPGTGTAPSASCCMSCCW